MASFKPREVISILQKLGFINEKESSKADALLNEVLRMLNKMTSNARH